jgi:hypothetical protein
MLRRALVVVVTGGMGLFVVPLLAALVTRVVPAGMGTGSGLSVYNALYGELALSNVLAGVCLGGIVALLRGRLADIIIAVSLTGVVLPLWGISFIGYPGNTTEHWFANAIVSLTCLLVGACLVALWKERKRLGEWGR